MKTSIKDNIFTFLYKSGGYRLFRPFYGGIGCILMFHRILPASPVPRITGAQDIEVTPEFLEVCIFWFRSQGYEIISLDEMHTRMINGNKENVKWVVFTLDDGYIDNYLYAYPIFKKHNVPFTIYLTTSFPMGTATMWWYHIEDIALDNETVKVLVDGEEKWFDAQTPEQKKFTYDSVSKIYRAELSGTNERELLNKIFGTTNEEIVQKTKALSLSWDQVKELSSDPLCTIGAHTINHRNLKNLSFGDCKSEILECSSNIERIVGKKIEHFCYPYGTKHEAGEREVNIVEKSSYKTATTTRAANIFNNHRNCMSALPRIPIIHSQMLEGPKWFALWTSGVVSAMRNRLKRVITI